MNFLAAPTLAFGQTSGSGDEGSQEPSTKALHGGILPLRDFGGDLSSRANLLGDWGGLRTDLAKKGIRFRGWLTPNFQRVADGGSEDDTAFGASGDFWSALDFHRMGVIPGGLLTIPLASRFDRNVDQTQLPLHLWRVR